MTTIKTKALHTLAAAAAVVVLISGCAGAGRPAAKRMAPEFSVELMAGGNATLEQFRGRPLILNIGASWCPHCRHELPTFNEASKKYGDRVAILMVFSKSPREEIQELIDDHGLKFMVGHDPDSVVKEAFGVKGIPVTFFIDPDGYIVDDYLGGISERELTGKINALLGRSG